MVWRCQIGGGLLSRFLISQTTLEVHRNQFSYFLSARSGGDSAREMVRECWKWFLEMMLDADLEVAPDL